MQVGVEYMCVDKKKISKRQPTMSCKMKKNINEGSQWKRKLMKHLQVVAGDAALLFLCLSDQHYYFTSTITATTPQQHPSLDHSYPLHNTLTTTTPHQHSSHHHNNNHHHHCYYYYYTLHYNTTLNDAITTHLAITTTITTLTTPHHHHTYGLGYIPPLASPFTL